MLDTIQKQASLLLELLKSEVDDEQKRDDLRSDIDMAYDQVIEQLSADGDISYLEKIREQSFPASWSTNTKNVLSLG